MKKTFKESGKAAQRAAPFRVVMALFAGLLLLHTYVWGQAAFDRSAYYAAFEGSQVSAMEEQLSNAAILKGVEKDAFEGALLMRKAGVESAPAQKLMLFKQGAEKLEAAIKASPQNAEYRFLRLMIQENAPRMLGYHSDIEADSNLVKRQLKSLSKPTQDAVSRYSRKSKYL